MVQSFVHAANVAVAHLDFENILAMSSCCPAQAGRPFVMTDPNPPITYGDVYTALRALSKTRLRIVRVPPAPVLVVSTVIHQYCLLVDDSPLLGHVLPALKGSIKQLRSPLFDITRHMFATNDNISRPRSDGGLGYTGVISTMDGIIFEVVEWNRTVDGDKTQRRHFRSSVDLGNEIQESLTANGNSSSTLMWNHLVAEKERKKEANSS